MPKFNLYTAWMDPVFYAWAAVFAAALVAMVYSIRKYVELKNASFDEDDRTGEAEAYADVPVVDGPAEEPAAEAAQPVQQELPAAAAEEAPQPDAGLACAEEAAPAPADDAGSSRAETFVRGIYDGISGLDARLKSIESSLSKGRVNNDFTVKFLEDILQDIDGLDKAKIKARLEYLVSDLKK